MTGETLTLLVFGGAQNVPETAKSDPLRDVMPVAFSNRPTTPEEVQHQ